MKKYTNMEMNIFRLFGQYYLYEVHKDEENVDNAYNKTNQSITSLGITHMSFDQDNKYLEISLSRPGLLIGVKGQNITNLKTYLQKNTGISNLEIKIIEDNLMDYIIPVNYSDDFDDY